MNISKKLKYVISLILVIIVFVSSFSITSNAASLSSVNDSFRFPNLLDNVNGIYEKYRSFSYYGDDSGSYASGYFSQVTDSVTDTSFYFNLQSTPMYGAFEFNCSTRLIIPASVTNLYCFLRFSDGSVYCLQDLYTGIYNASSIECQGVTNNGLFSLTHFGSADRSGATVNYREIPISIKFSLSDHFELVGKTINTVYFSSHSSTPTWHFLGMRSPLSVSYSFSDDQLENTLASISAIQLQQSIIDANIKATQNTLNAMDESNMSFWDKIVARFDSLVESFSSNKPWYEKLWDAVTFIPKTINSGWNSFNSWFSQTWLGSQLSSIKDGIVSKLHNFSEWFQDTKFGGWFTSVVTGIRDNISDFFSDPLGFIKDRLNDLKNGILNLKDKVVALWDKICNSVQENWVVQLITLKNRMVDFSTDTNQVQIYSLEESPPVNLSEDDNKDVISNSSVTSDITNTDLKLNNDSEYHADENYILDREYYKSLYGLEFDTK